MAELEERAIECSRSVESKPKYVSEAAENIPWDELEQIVLRLSPRSRRNAVEAFKSWLIRVREASERGESEIFVLNGEWGVGKTALRRTLLRNEAEKIGYKVKEIRFDDFMNDIKKNYNRYGIIEGYLSLFENTLREYLQEVGNISEENPLLLFIDEVEGIIGLYDRQETVGDVNAGHAFIQFLREFRSKDSRFALDLKGKIHLVLFITPFALNFITRQLGPEYSGWLLRRESIYNLYPLDKYETIEFIRESLKYLLGMDIGKIVVDDYRLLEIFYTISNGNIGILVKLLSDILYYFYRKCTEKYDKDCVCIIDYSTLLNALKTTTVLKNYEQSVLPLNYDIIRRIEYGSDIFRLQQEEAKSILLKMAVSSSVIYDKEMNTITYFTLKKLSLNFDINIVRYRIYKLDNIWSIMDDLVNDLSLENPQLDIDLLRGAVMCLIHLTKGGEYVLAVPIDDDDTEISLDELRAILSSYTLVNVTEVFAKRLSSRLSNIKYEKGFGLSSSTKSLIYPTYVSRVIPFITDVDTMKEISDNIIQLYKRSPDDLSNKIFAGLIAMLEEEGIVVRKGKNIVLKDFIDVNVYVIPIIAKIDKELLNKYISDEKSCILVFVPRELSLAELNWNMFVYRMDLYDMFLIAARTLLQSFGKQYSEKFIDKKKLKEFYDNIINKYNLGEISKKWRAKAIEQGIFVSSSLGIEDLPEVAASRRKAHIVLADHYKTLLCCGHRISLEQLEELLLGLYYIRPIIKDLEFIPLVDIEPNNPKYLRYNYNFRYKVKEMIYKSIELCEKTNLIEIKGHDLYLMLHPIEKRITRILKDNKEINVSDLEDFFVFENYNAKTIFNNLYLDILVHRGYVRFIEEKKYKRKESVKIISLSTFDSKSIESLVTEIDELIQLIYETLNKSGIDISFSINHILVTKEHGWKLILLNDIIETINKFKELLISSSDSAVYYALIILKEYLKKLFENYINKSIEEINGFKLKMKSNISATLSSITAISNTLAKFEDVIDKTVIEGIRDCLKGFQDEVEQKGCKTIENIDYLARIKVDDLVRLIESSIEVERRKGIQNTMQKFRYDKPNENYFNFIYYVAKNSYFEEFNKYILKISDDLDKINKLTLEIKQKLESLSYQSKITLTDILKSKIRVSAQFKELDDVFIFLSHVLRVIEGEIDLIRMREHQIEKIKSELNIIHNKFNKIKDQFEKVSNRLKDIQYISNSSGNILTISFDDFEKINNACQNIEILSDKINNLDSKIEQYKRNIVNTFNLDVFEDIKMDLENEINNISIYLREIEKNIENLEEKMKSNYMNIVDNLLISFENNNKLLLKLNADFRLLTKMGELLQHTRELKSIKKLSIEYIDKLNNIMRSIPEFNEIVSKLVYEHLGKDVYPIYVALRDSRFAHESRLSDLVFFIKQRCTNLSESEILELLLKLDKENIVEIRLKVNWDYFR